MKIQNYIKENSGQIVLILVLITVVGLTIGLSLISRTITDVRISTQIEQSGRAFSAAEAGVESALKSGESGATGTVTFPGVSASYNVVNLGGEIATLSFPLTAVGSTQTVWFAEHQSDGISLDESNTYDVDSSFTICWGTDPNKKPALLLSLYYKDTFTGVYKVAKAAFDSDPAGNNSKFEAAEQNVNTCSNNYLYKKTLSASAEPWNGFGIPSANTILLALRIQPIFDDTAIAVVPTASLPVQGKLITSIGQTETGVVRKIQVTQGYQVLPTLLDFALFTEQ